MSTHTTPNHPPRALRPATAWRRMAWATCSLAAAAALPGLAQAGTGKLLLTGGVSSVDGAAGGGLTPWALIGTQATEGETGVSAHLTRSVTQDYALTTQGVTLGWNERLEISLAQQDFKASPAVALNAIGPFGVAAGEHIRMNVLGVKLRLAGEAVLDADTWMPQIAVGIEHKRVDPGTLRTVLDFLGADVQGTDVYVSATKLFLAPGVLVNGTLRLTQANQNGLLGFGAASPGRDSARVQPEFSVAYLINRHWAIGAEYRFKPDNLRRLGQAAGLGDALREDDWKDVFVAWAPGKHLSLTLAYVDLGRIVPGITSNRRQTGAYLSAQLAF